MCYKNNWQFLAHISGPTTYLPFITCALQAAVPHSTRACCDMDGTVLGHYVPDARDGWVPTLANSTDLFKSLVADDLTAFERQAAELDASEGSSGSTSSWHTLLYWSGGGLQQAAPPPLVADGSSSTSDAVASKVQAKQRTLLMLATQHGSVRVLAYLLSKGQGCPTDKAPGDGVDCYQVSGLGVGEQRGLQKQQARARGTRPQGWVRTRNRGWFGCT